jgi:hypothetical protein
MKKYFYFGLTILTFIVINIIVIKKYFKVKNEVGQISQSLNIAKEDVSFFMNKFTIEAANENLKLDGNIHVVGIRNDTFTIKQIINKHTLIFRYSVLNCNACVDSQIQILSEFLNETGLDVSKICFFAYYEDLHDLVSTYRAMKYKFPFYIVQGNNLNFPIEKQNIPYYFETDTSLRIKNVFIPKRELPKLTRQYFESMKRGM